LNVCGVTDERFLRPLKSLAAEPFCSADDASLGKTRCRDNHGRMRPRVTNHGETTAISCCSFFCVFGLFVWRHRPTFG